MAAFADKTAGERVTFPNQAGITLCGVLTIKDVNSRSVVILCHGSFCDKVNKNRQRIVCFLCRCRSSNVQSFPR